MKAVFVALLFAVFVSLCFANEVTVLTSENFESSVAEGAWLIKFYAPWCGHCKRLAPTWDELAAKVGTNFHVGKVDCTQNQELCQAHEVRGYPTILAFNAGTKEKYAGQRTVGDFASFMEKKFNVPTTTL